MWIWENSNWPSFTWDSSRVEEKLKSFVVAEARIEALLSTLPHDARTHLSVMNLASDIYFSSKMEDVEMEDREIYKAVSKAMGFEEKTREDKYLEDLADLMVDSMETEHSELSLMKLLYWHSLLLRNLKGTRMRDVGTLRNTPVYIVKSSGMFGSKVMYEAVPHNKLMHEIDRLLSFMNDESHPVILRTAVSALWLPLIHPFDDGNGRISRIFSDSFLFSNLGCRPASISTAIYWKRHEYYNELAKYNKADNLDITDWICWYIDLVTEEYGEASNTLSERIEQTKRVMELDPYLFNSREIIMLYKLTSGAIQERLTAEKWSKLTGCKSATATRDLAHLVESGYLIRSEEGGRTTSYLLYRDAI